jgi:hypothetical protein
MKLNNVKSYNIILIFIFILISILISNSFNEVSYASTDLSKSSDDYCVIKVDPYLCSQDASFYIQHALNFASYNEDILYKIVISPLDDDNAVTEYNLDRQLKIYSNTWLYVDDFKKPIIFQEITKNGVIAVAFFLKKM